MAATLATPRTVTPPQPGGKVAVRSAAAVGVESVCSMSCAVVVVPSGVVICTLTTTLPATSVKMCTCAAVMVKVLLLEIKMASRTRKPNWLNDASVPLSVKVASTTGPIMWPGRSGGGV